MRCQGLIARSQRKVKAPLVDEEQRLVIRVRCARGGGAQTPAGGSQSRGPREPRVAAHYVHLSDVAAPPRGVHVQRGRRDARGARRCCYNYNVIISLDYSEGAIFIELYVHLKAVVALWAQVVASRRSRSRLRIARRSRVEY